MGGWKIGKMKVEEMTDVDPAVYRRRAKIALDNGQYSIAMQEAKMALKYSNNDMSEHLRIVNIMYKMQEYKRCLEYIRQHRIVEYIFTEEYDNGFTSFSLSEFFKIYLQCWKESGCRFEQADVIVVAADGTGMVKTLQDAINANSQCHKIAVIASRGEESDFDLTNAGIKIKGVVEGQDLCVVVRTDVPVNLVINSGSVKIINSRICVGNHSVGIEINGGNVLLKNTNVAKSDYRLDGEFSIGIHIKNQSLISIRHCEFHLRAGVFAECGKIDVIDTRLYDDYGIVAMGKTDKVFLKLNNLSLGSDGYLLIGFNTDTQIFGGSFGEGITLEGKTFNNCQDDAIMNIYDASVYRIAAYNGGNIYLHNVKDINCLEADNGKILGENCRGDRTWDIAELRLGIGKNTEIVCDCKYKVFNELLNKCRMGAFLNKIKWLAEK